MPSEIACGDSGIGQSGGRKDVPTRRCDLCYSGKEGELRMSLLLFSQCNVRSGHLLRTETVEGEWFDVCAGALKREEEK